MRNDPRANCGPAPEVTFPASTHGLARHLIWMLKRRLIFLEGGFTHELGSGDCIALGSPAPCTYRPPRAQALL
ncbi:MAG TPA: hypothetical protein VG994_16885 [Steroidobacteraceae bacterium]|nr:hypothetical protein [Steroidobacteraceae bacterium]